MRVHLVHLPADATTADPTLAAPLGSRVEVAARIAELLPGVVFDEGYGTFRRASYELILTIHGAEPIAVDVLFDKPEGFAALKRVVDKTGWRAIDPSTKTFVDLEASQAAKALVAATPGKSRAAAPAGASGQIAHDPSRAEARAEVAPSLTPNPVMLIAAWSAAAVVIALSQGISLPVPALVAAPIVAAVAQWLVMLQQVSWSREWGLASGLQMLIYIGLIGLVGDGSASSGGRDPFLPLVVFVVSSIPQAVMLWDRAERPLIWAATRPIRPLITMALGFAIPSAAGSTVSFIAIAFLALIGGVFDAVSFVFSVWSRAFASAPSLPDLRSARLSGSRLYWALGGVASLLIFAFVTLPMILDGRLALWGRDPAADSAGSSHGIVGKNLNGNATAARQAVDTIRDCVERFRSAHPDKGFPARLEQVGPSGEQCLSAEIASGETAGYTFAYNTGVPNTAGQVQLYSICATPASAASGPATFVANQRHATRVHVSGQRLPNGGDACAQAYSDTVAAIEHCATTFAAGHAGTGYPPTLGDVRNCIVPKDSADFRTHSMGDKDYRYTYIAGSPDARGLITTFEIYGINHASTVTADQIFANETGVIRIARGQRLPGPGDPTLEDDLKVADQGNVKAKALQEIATPCDAGDQAACSELASRTLEGVRQSLPSRDEVAISSALRLYVTACEARVASACAGLGEFYTDGKLVPLDLERGVTPYDRACTMGNAAACHSLAMVLRRAPRQTPAAAANNERRAIVLDERGCKMNDSASCLGLAAALADGRDKSAQARVPTLLETSCRLGDPEGCYRLAAFKGNDQRLLLKACARGDFPDCSKVNPPTGAPASN